MEITMKKLELLAPAGSLVTLKAVVNAGADAVYLGGEMFGARAYANNFTKEELFEGIDYGHRYGSRVILAVNTLLKEHEIREQLYDYILPYYEHGIDAVIVQDLGVMEFLHEQFPLLPLHTSTQMTVTGVNGAKLLVERGASRVVMARELSYTEIKKIHEAVDAELEGFVHGALCYCYSGQCLLSSMLGGRSGNRGRCAQPCRLPYEVLDENGKRIGKPENYILSPKDLCTIDHIPELAESGLYSFKVEGRMKQAEYAAGVVSIYRKYMDRYLEYGKEGYCVSGEDQQKLFDLGNRSGFTDGYYRRHNGREMITFDRPGHTRGGEALQEQIRKSYIEVDKKEAVTGRLVLKKEHSAVLEVRTEAHQVKVTGELVQQALKRPLTEETVREKAEKTGNTPYRFEKLKIDMDDDIFLPVQALNQLRRDALEKLAATEAEGCRRKAVEAVPYRNITGKLSLHEKKSNGALHEKPYLAVSVEQPDALDAVLEADFVKRIYLDGAMLFPPESAQKLRQSIARIKSAGKEAYYAFPFIFRERTRERFETEWENIKKACPDGYLIKSYDALGFCEKMKIPADERILDHNMYTWSDAAKAAYQAIGIKNDTAPVELNRHELLERTNSDSELILYGYLPLMVSAQCVHANMEGCDRMRSVRYLKDRYHKLFAVKNNCNDCYMILYNSSPLSLLHQKQEIGKMGFAGYRLQFTNETGEQVKKVLTLYRELWLEGKDVRSVPYLEDYTNGHFKRGVE